jgi:hypothetical protein
MSSRPLGGLCGCFSPKSQNRCTPRLHHRTFSAPFRLHAVVRRTCVESKSPRRRCIASGKLRPGLMAGSSRRIPGANDGYMCPECVSTTTVTTVLDGGEQGSAALRHGGSLCMAGPAWQKSVVLGLRRHSCEGWIGGDTGLMKGGWITLYKRSLEPRLPSRRRRSALRCQ